MSDISLTAEVIAMLDGTYYAHVQVVTVRRCKTTFEPHGGYCKTFISEHSANVYCEKLLNYFNNSRA